MGSPLLRGSVASRRRAHVVSGARRITMQLARMRFRAWAHDDRPNWKRSCLARRIERGQTKAQMSRSLRQPARRWRRSGRRSRPPLAPYFGLPAAELDLAASAALLTAALPNRSGAFGFPTIIPPRSRVRRRLILARDGGERRHRSPGRFPRGRRKAWRSRRAQRESSLHPHLLLRLAGSAPSDAVRIATTLDVLCKRFVENETPNVVWRARRTAAFGDGAALVIREPHRCDPRHAGSAGYFARTGAGKTTHRRAGGSRARRSSPSSMSSPSSGA